MSNEGYLKIQTCVLKVNIHCEDCRRKVKKILHEIEGVYVTKLEIDSKKVTVMGNVDPNILIKTLVKKGKRAEIWDAQTSQTNMTENLQIDNGNTGGKKEEEKEKEKEEEKEKEKEKKKKQKGNTGNGGNQSKGVGGGHIQWSDLTPQQKLQLQLWQQQQQLTRLTPFQDPRLFMPIPMHIPIIKNQMQELQKAVRFNIPNETNEDETSDDEEDDHQEDDDHYYFPQQLPFNMMNTTGIPMMTANGMFNSQQFRNYANNGQGNLSCQMNGNGKNIQNLYVQTVGGMQYQANNNGRWSNGHFTMNMGNGSLGVQNLGYGYPPNMVQTSNMPMGYMPLVMIGNNPSYQQQQLAVGMMNQQPLFNNERFQPTMYNQLPPVTNYMPHSYPQPSDPYMYALSDENTSSCNVM